MSAQRPAFTLGEAGRASVNVRQVRSAHSLVAGFQPDTPHNTNGKFYCLSLEKLCLETATVEMARSMPHPRRIDTTCQNDFLTWC